MPTTSNDSVLKVTTDGGSRGNPGQAASAFVVWRGRSKINKYGERIGIKTNNEAEYYAVVLALKWILENYKSVSENEIKFFLDSELVVRQLNGIYKIKNLNLQKFAIKIKTLEKEIGKKISYSYFPRDKNKDADFLVNQVLDNML